MIKLIDYMLKPTALLAFIPFIGLILYKYFHMRIVFRTSIFLYIILLMGFVLKYYQDNNSNT